MLDEYREDRAVWESNPDHPNLRSDILGTDRIISLLGPVPGKRILDLGCGNGKVSRRLARKGAQVTGVDLIPEQIDFAAQREQEDPLGITYLQGDLTDLDSLGLPAESFDIILCLMTHLYLDEQAFEPSLTAARRYLRSGGSLFYLNIHPFRTQGDYFPVKPCSATLPTVGGEPFRTTFYHHPLAFVLNSFIRAGLQIRQVLEPKPTEEELAEYPAILAGSNTSPFYLIIEAGKGSETPL